MAIRGPMRSSVLPLFSKLLRSEALSTPSPSQRALISPTFTDSQFSRNYATATGKKEEKVKVPLALFGEEGKYASALYLAAVKGNVLEKVEMEVLDLVESGKKSPAFSGFAKDPTVRKDVRMKAIEAICAEAKLAEITKNFLLVIAQNGRLKSLEKIANKFQELTMAHRGEVKVFVTSVIPLPAAEEKELKETMQEILGKDKTVLLEQKIDPSILGGIVVEFQHKVFDMSIKTRAKQMERFLRESTHF